MAKHFKLGPNAHSFFDSSTRKQVSPGSVVKFENHELKSERTKSAIHGGHLVEVHPADVKELEEARASKEAPVEKGLTKDQLLAKIQEEYEIDDEELAGLKKMKKDDLLKYYESLLADSGEEKDDEDEEDDEEEES